MYTQCFLRKATYALIGTNVAIWGPHSTRTTISHDYTSYDMIQHIMVTHDMS